MTHVNDIICKKRKEDLIMLINKQTIEQIISNLSQRMPAFLNEAHLQYEFAIELKRMFPKTNCILEYRPIVNCYKQGFNKKKYYKR